MIGIIMIKKLINIAKKTLLIIFFNISLLFGLSVDFSVKPLDKTIKDTNFSILYKKIAKNLKEKGFKRAAYRASKKRRILESNSFYSAKLKKINKKRSTKSVKAKSIERLTDKQISKLIPYYYSKENLEIVIDIIKTLNYLEKNTKYKIKKDIGLGAEKVVFSSESGDAIILFLKSKKREKKFIKEVSILNKLNHKNIINLKEYNKEYFFMIQELAKYDLWDFFDSTKDVSLLDILSCFKDVAEGLDHIHKNGIIHRDIKPKNMLIFGNKIDGYTAKICDFSFAKKLIDKKNTIKSYCKGTFYFIEPEILNKSYVQELEGLKEKKVLCCIKNDIYAFGMMLYNMLYDININKYFKKIYKTSELKKTDEKFSKDRFRFWLSCYLSKGKRAPFKKENFRFVFTDESLIEYLNLIITVCWYKDIKERKNAEWIVDQLTWVIDTLNAVIKI
ncbi:protein kinase [Candidatus Dependentiae bacterium]|nr:protein kinase [Candidatus Dependentiae bacterium]